MTAIKYHVWLTVAIVLFIVGLALGLLTPRPFTDAIDSEAKALDTLTKIIAGLPPILAALTIFFKNSLALLFSFGLSPVIGLMPALTLLINGWLLGFASIEVIEQKSLTFFFAGILPHGILEIPAVIMGEAAALVFGTALLRAVFKKDAQYLAFAVKTSIKYLIIALIILLPAAFIEVLVTPQLLRLFK